MFGQGQRESACRLLALAHWSAAWCGDAAEEEGGYWEMERIKGLGGGRGGRVKYSTRAPITSYRQHSTKRHSTRNDRARVTLAQ